MQSSKATDYKKYLVPLAAAAISVAALYMLRRNTRNATLSRQMASVQKSCVYQQCFKNSDGVDLQPLEDETLIRKLVAEIENTLEKQGMPELRNDAVVYEYYLPLALWLRKQVAQGKKAGAEGAVCVALSIPQGGGKTSLSNCLESALFKGLGIKTAVISYDDLYLTNEDQQKVTNANPSNKFLAGRGVAGTHDMQLGIDKLREMIYDSADGKSISVPQYDKTAFNGKGDRFPKDKWKQIDGKIDLVIVEGWMLGYRKVDESNSALQSFQTYEGELESTKHINSLMTQYEQHWHPFFDASILVGVNNPDIVYKWREEAENTQRRSKGLGAMSKEQIYAFCERFMKCYKIYLPELMEQGLLDDKTREVKFYLDDERKPFVKS